MEISRKEIEAIKGMSVPEKLMIVEEIWDSIATGQSLPTLSDSQQHELDKRYKAYKTNPEEGRLWDDIKNEHIRGKE